MTIGSRNLLFGMLALLAPAAYAGIHTDSIDGSPADLSVGKQGPIVAAAGGPINYTIHVANAGPNPALNVQLTDVLVSSTFTALTAPAGWSCTTPAINASGTVACTLASMPVGSNVFTLLVNASGTPGFTTNVATVTSDNDSTPGNNTAFWTTNISLLADLSITKTGPANAIAGSRISYTLDVANNGPSTTLLVSITDVLPAALTLVSATPTQGSCLGTTTVTCTVGNLSNAATASISVVVDISPTANGTLTNTASVTSIDADPNPGNNTSSSSVNVSGGATPVAAPATSIWSLLAMAVSLLLLVAMRLLAPNPLLNR
ncbi:MAG: DUF11 domain-containing protein [Tahibacter sp.]